MTSECFIHHWLLDISSGSLIHQQTGEQRRLGEYQLKLLIVLVQHAGKILTRDELNTLVWERRVIGNNSLPNAIHALRVALEDDGKQQRIIKTIPKKGYILEADFCQFRREPAETEEDEVSVEENLAEPLAEEEIREAPDAALSEFQVAQAEWNAATQQENERLTAIRQAKRNRIWRRVSLVQALALVALVALLLVIRQAGPRNDMTMQDEGVYSNIRLFELTRSYDRLATREDINNLLSSTLFALNQMMASQKVDMDVFFFTSGSTLNYTLALKNRCERRQLALNISQWHTDLSELNDLIYRETERKLNEMATCINESGSVNAAGADYRAD
ncbi:winged helix-turn-helix domain-containing protein [Erwinia oleae]|uniref:winged helix-turn-helix domain-containing protein n=1 Tax=Erwinia oleae TaxID=796334 RepID=UPI000690AF3C|nr:transcriptional regulator [Erwinia oleae]